MSISIIGAGNVGMALGQSFIRAGESIVFGVPEPEAYRSKVAALGGQAQVLSPEEAIAANEIVILAVPHGAVSGIAKILPDWTGKILVDATNPLTPGLDGLTVGTTSSGAEALAKLAPGARVVKAFNTTGADNMADTAYPGGKPFMPVCGDDAQARQKIIELASKIGFEAFDLGPLAAARYLEPFAMTWIHMAVKQGYGRKFAFCLMRRD